MKKLCGIFFSLALCSAVIQPMSANYEESRPKAWYASYHDPIFGTPIRVRYTPTKQEALEYDIQNFLRKTSRMPQNQSHAQQSAGSGQSPDQLLARSPMLSNSQILIARTALFTRSLMWGSPSQAAELLAANADPNSPDNRGNLPLHTATKYTNIPVLQFLITAKADIDARNQQNNTVLHVAAHKENPALVCALLAAGANPEIRGQDGITALEYLENRKIEYQEMREQLIRDNQKFESKNRGEPLPTFSAVMQNLQGKLDTLYTICAAIEKSEEKVEHPSGL